MYLFECIVLTASDIKYIYMLNGMFLRKVKIDNY